MSWKQAQHLQAMEQSVVTIVHVYQPTLEIL